MLINFAYADTETITVEDTQALPKAPGAAEPNWISSLVPMVLIFAVFYFLLIRPQERKRRVQQELTNGVKKGEEVLLNSGMFGIVSKINDSDNTIYVEIAKDIEIKVLKNSIADIISRNKKELPVKTNSDKKNTKQAEK